MQQDAFKKAQKNTTKKKKRMAAANEISVGMTNWLEVEGISTFKKKGGDERCPSHQ